MLRGRAGAGLGDPVGLEFLPWSNIETVHDGLSLVRDAGAAAGGLIIDARHTERAHTPPADLAAVPVRYIVGVELDDADAEPVGTLFDDTVKPAAAVRRGRVRPHGHHHGAARRGVAGPVGRRDPLRGTSEDPGA